MSYFDNDGCQLHYEDYGRGMPVLLIHGLGSSTRDWEYQVPALAAHYRVIVIDVRGHGRSDKPNERYSIAAFADDVTALIEHLKLIDVHLVGISMGGMIGFQLAVDHPELLRSLTIVNSGPEVKPHSPKEYLEIAKRWTLSRLLSLDSIAKALGGLLFPLPEQADLRRKIEERWPQNDKRAYLSALNAIIGWGVRDRLQRIKCPTLVITADRDYTPVAKKETYVKELPNARLVVIKNSRHATPLDQPERFNTTLLDFIAEVERKKDQIPC
ncbi:MULTISPECIES: alpha/beta fold hydrolase [unclassified Pseudomonas]|jgi:pimeloyl-ACP methyl ester carboxylesterase|uniref:alpha/beta fold hydrolase n=1 Tax=unclassified Pseudomonas TaxID=196821 RepID=UPI000EA8A50F|nr:MULTISPECIES: alpha/beta hydrolase [unclassified Pseudomonas]AYF87729.1 alpha/beta hydrolase [Pseudomonas sp. DY-1]MDH4655508.1 alpha/beta hydrolase [Pseudomonas sp. BN606]MRK19989.1 alpha/beta hydrolase [Pseudomonas sp. JG-B]